jgi:RHS repeat-associated protein
VVRGFTASHGDMAITSKAAYGNDIARIMTYSGGRLWRQINEAGGWAWLHGYEGGRVKADTLRAGAPGDPCPPPTEETGAECPGFYQSFPTILETHAFAYDSAGNRRDQGGTYGTGNRITGFAGCTYGTDPSGNVVSRSCPGVTATFSWDAENRLSSWTVNGVTIGHVYDAWGQLVSRTSGPYANHYLWDRGNLFAMLGNDGSRTAEYSYYPGLDRLHALVVDTTRYYAHTDAAGNVMALTAGNGSLARTYWYDTWGQLTGGTDYVALSGTDMARFKGALHFQLNGVELHYMRNRLYEPKTGRFLSEDPIWLDGGINLYTFAGNDPVNLRDPVGVSC